MRCACLVVVVALGCGHDAVVATSAAPGESPKPKSPCVTDAIQLGPGLRSEQREVGAKPAAGAPCIDVVRADLAHHRLRILSAARDGASRPATAWREAFHLTAVINAGMFHTNGDPVALIVDNGVALSADNKAYLGYFAFDPVAKTDPPVLVTGRDCPHFSLADLRTRYRSIVQAPRLLGCAGEPLPWQDKKHYSAAAIGVDRQGRVILIHARAAFTMTELAIAVGDLNLAGALFLEGGPEASLVVRGADGELSRVGSYETGFVDNDTNQSFWWLPNVIGLEALP